MRILVVSNMWPSPTRPVLGIFVEEQVKALKQAGFDVEVLSIDGSGLRKSAYLSLPLVLHRQAKAFNPDIVHAHYGLTGAMCALKKPCPLVVTYHGSDVFIPWQYRFSRLSAKRADVNICVSEFLKSKLGDPNAQVVPCGVDTALFRPFDRTEARRKLNLPADSSVVLFGGSRSNPIKNFTLFEAAMTRLQRPSVLTLELAGLDRNMVPLYMNAADLMVVTSKHEGYSLVVTEALACGLPVISVPVGNIPDRIQDLPTCRVVTRDPGSIAVAIAEVLDYGKRIEPIPALNGLSTHDTTQQLSKIYRRLCPDSLR